MHTTKNDLPSDARRSVAELLNQRLVDCLDLRLAAKQAHWNVKGHNFIALHQLFDEVAEHADEFADLMAERAVQLGALATGTSQAVSKASTLPAYPLDAVESEHHVQALSDALAYVGQLVRQAIDRAGQLGDQGTADLFTEVSRGLDKDLWFVEAHRSS